jgi:putative ABC transport system permease protein
VFLLLTSVFLSGLYPVFLLSSFRPMQVLKGKLGNKPKGLNLRMVLVVFQFTMAICLITFTYAVFKQISFLKSQPLGFTIDQVYAVRSPRFRDEGFKDKVKAFKEELLKHPGISDMCVVTEVPGRQIYWDAGGIHPVGSDDSKNYQIVGVDYDFVGLFNTRIIEGRNFSRDFPSDTVALILNETAVKWMGFPDAGSVIGQQINYWDIIYTVIGVMKDYHQQSPKEAFEPHIYRLTPYGRGVRGMFVFRLTTEDTKVSVRRIQKMYDDFFPGNSFESFFLDDYFNQQYKADLMVGKVFGIFSLLAVFITVLGIFGLFSFMTLQRTKEISIRNILGAGTVRILFLFASEFLLLILFSFVIAFAISFVGIDRWMDSFSVKMDIGPGLFLLPLALVILVAGLTISSQVLKVTLTNPVENLRYE